MCVRGEGAYRHYPLPLRVMRACTCTHTHSHNNWGGGSKANFETIGVGGGGGGSKAILRQSTASLSFGKRSSEPVLLKHWQIFCI